MITVTLALVFPTNILHRLRRLARTQGFEVSTCLVIIDAFSRRDYYLTD